MSFEFNLIRYINNILNIKNINLRNDLDNLDLKKKYSEQKTKLFKYNKKINSEKIRNYLITDNLNEIYNKEHIHYLSYFIIIFIITCLLYLSGLAYCKINVKYRSYFNVCLAIYWILILPLFSNKLINRIILIYRLSFFTFIVMTVIFIKKNKCKKK